MVLKKWEESKFYYCLRLPLKIQCQWPQQIFLYWPFQEHLDEIRDFLQENTGNLLGSLCSEHTHDLWKIGQHITMTINDSSNWPQQAQANLLPWPVKQSGVKISKLLTTVSRSFNYYETITPKQCSGHFSLLVICPEPEIMADSRQYSNQNPVSPTKYQFWSKILPQTILSGQCSIRNCNTRGF